MNTKYSQLKKIATISGFLIGAFALSVIAAEGVWNEAECAPPDCNVYAPINVGPFPQYKNESIGLKGLAVGTGNSAPTSGYNMEIAGISKLEGLTVNGTLNVLNKTLTPKLLVSGGDSNQAGYVLTNVCETEGGGQVCGNAQWKPAGGDGTGGGGVVNVDITSWPRAWYIPNGSSDSLNPLPMIKVTSFGDNRGPANNSKHDMGGCPPKAVQVGFDKNGLGNIALLCAAPTLADLPSTFDWVWK